MIITRGEITLFGKKKNENQEIEEKKEKKSSDSGLVTKESFCSTCAVFSFLAFLILCTRTLIFGSVGETVHIFLTGVFGYLAYPVILGALYLSVMGLFGKRLVKNRKVGACIALAVIFLSLLVHTIVTYSWQVDGYLKACFQSGETFPNTAPTGFLGGTIVLGFSKLFSAIGAAVAFGILALLCGYLCYVQLKKKAPKDSPEEISVDEQLSTLPEREIAPAQAEQPVVAGQNVGYMQPETLQRPGVSLDDGTAGQATGQGFSPFGIPNTNENKEEPTTREMLFGGTPAEQFQRNLLFDPNAKVNQRKGIDIAAQPTLQKEYTPSYTQAYEKDLNTQPEQRPAKVVTDRAPDYHVYEESAPQTPMQTPAWEQPPVEKAWEEPTAEKPAWERVSIETPVERVESPIDRYEEEPAAPPATPVEERKEEPYKRHDYMDIFSSSNPNVFGNDEESARFGREFADRALSRSQQYNTFEEQEERRDGMRLFDEEEQDDPYTLRSDFDTPSRTEARFDEGRRLEEVSPSRNFEREEDTRGRGLEEEVVRGRGFEEESRGRGMEEERVVEPPKPAEQSKPVEPPKPRIIKPYVRPLLDDFDCRDIQPTANEDEIRQTKENIIATLEEFKIVGASISSVTFGPTVTRYNVTIPRNISPKKVVALTEPISISLYSSGVSIYPNYEDGVVSIEVPNKERQFVQLGCMLTGDSFINSKPSSLMFAMGKDVANRKVYGDVCKMVHLLVAGSTKAGKSVFLGSLIISLIYKYSPEELRLILIDPKKTEFVLYNNLPHLMINEIITDANKAVQSLNWAIGEMNRRYSLFEKMSRSGKYVVNLDQYNEQLEKAERLPKIVIIIDELADLMLAAKKEIEDRIQNLTQKARAAGIHLIVATQRPSTDVITGVIKSNLTTRIAFLVATDVDSRVILDQSGAQKLLGMGDFLYTMPGINQPVRVQSAFISPEDSQKVVNYIKNNNEAYYDEEATAYINSRGGNGGDSYGNGGDGGVDPMYIEALRFVIQSNSASISMIQRKCSAGYNRAGKIVEWMEDMGYISPFDGAKARKVLISKEEFESKYGPL